MLPQLLIFYGIILYLSLTCLYALPLEEISFSGVYFPDLNNSLEVYAGAWLLAIPRLIASEDKVRKILALEGASFAIVKFGLTLMTRDYFDFQVLHLSATTNQLPVSTSVKFYNALTKKMQRTVDSLEQRSRTPVSSSADSRLRRKTIALIPFSTMTASTHLDYDEFQMAMRRLYFIATFWSVYRYIPHIVVTVASKTDLDALTSLNLPLWKIVDMSILFIPNAKPRARGSTHFLPKESLLFMIDRFKDSADGKPWDQFEYIYYTEGDHILHLRSENHIMDLLEANKAILALAPHRLQTLALPKAFPQFTSQWDQTYINSLQSVDLVTENETDPVGSCCDNGRFVFKECGNWWYNCERWGLQNYTQWLRFGKFGFTMPMGTEHKARCKYSPQKRLCELPPSCNARVPSGNKKICREMPNVEKTYGLE